MPPAREGAVLLESAAGGRCYVTPRGKAVGWFSLCHKFHEYLEFELTLPISG